MTGHDRASFKLLVTGVGGQGVLTAARLVGNAAMAAGADARVGQLHGLSQRGGEVEASVLIGPGQTGFISREQADVVLAFEPLEAERALPRMSANTVVVINTTPVVPFSLTQSGKPYPPIPSIVQSIRSVTDCVRLIEATPLARRAGDVRALNMVMLGALAGLELPPMRSADLAAQVREFSPIKTREINLRAFALGVEATAGVPLHERGGCR